jgi:hypothetical protein
VIKTGNILYNFEIRILQLSAPSVLAFNHIFLFQPNAHNMLNTFIYHQLPPKCFGVCYTVLRETIALLAQKLYAYLQFYSVA